MATHPQQAESEMNWLPSCFQLLSKSDTYITGLVSSEAELTEVLECHSKATLATFVGWCDDKKKNTDKGRRFLWQTEDISDNVPLTVTRRKILTCQHGKDYHKKKESKFQDIGDQVKKSRFHIQKTRKLNCPAKLFIRHITRYDDFKVSARASKKKREKTIRRVKESVLQKGTGGIDVIHVRLPLRAAHENHVVSEEIAFSSSIHPAIKEHIFDSVSQGITAIPVLKKNIKQFVCKMLCPPGSDQPHNGDRRYFPTSRTIQNQVHLALQAEEMSEFDQANLEDKVKAWLETDPSSFFFFRKSTKSYASFRKQDTAVTNSEGFPDSSDISRENKEASDDISPQSAFLFIHQTEKQRYLLERYGNIVLLGVMHRTTKCALPVFLLAVRTNFGYLPVAEFISERETSSAMVETLQIIKEWNPSWTPNIFVMDYSDEEYEALEEVFPDTQKLFCAFYVEQAWQKWIGNGMNDVSSDDGKELLQILRKIANAATQEIAAKEIELLRASTVYNRYQTVKNYLETQWLNMCQRWCRAYTPYDFNFTMRTNHGIDILYNSLKTFHLSLTETTTMSSLAERLVKDFVPDLLLMYSQHNYQSSSQYKAYNPTVPQFLHDRPKTFITACLKMALAASHCDDWEIHIFGNGHFKVKSEKKSESCNVYLGEEENHPFCDCMYFSTNFLPCKHMFAIFHNTDYTWESLPSFYRDHALFVLDSGCISEGKSPLLADINIILGEDNDGEDISTTTSIPSDKVINEKELVKAQKLLRKNIKFLSELSYLSTDVKALTEAAECVKKATNLLKLTVESPKDFHVSRDKAKKKGENVLAKKKKGRRKKRKHSTDGNLASNTESNCKPTCNSQPETAEISAQEDPPIPNKRSKFSSDCTDSTIQENEMSLQQDDNFKRKVLAFLDVAKVQQLSEFLMTVDMTPLTRLDDGESQMCRSLTAANSLLLETETYTEELDFIKEQICSLMLETWSEENFKEAGDIFQLLVATVLVAVKNNLSLDHIKEMFKLLPSHLVMPDNVNELFDKITVGSTTLTSADISTLGQEQWLNDQVLHAYLNLLMEEHPDKVFVFPSFLPLNWEKKKYNLWLYPKVDFMKYSWLIFMINHEHHWFLLVADTHSKAVFFVDSLKNEQREKYFFEHWCNYISARNKAVTDKTQVPSFKLVQMSSGKQLDGHSCGVFVLMNAEALLQNIPVGMMRQHHVVPYRQYVKRRLIAGGKTGVDVTCDLPSCFKPRENLDTIKCDKCGHWFHKTCADVIAFVKEEPFSCVFCIT